MKHLVVGQHDLYRGDCVRVMRTIPAGAAAACVTDPPYNVGFQYKTGDDQRGDYQSWCREWLSELERICAGGPIAISVGQANISLWATIKPPTWWLAWWKPAAMGRCVVGFNNWEPIALYGKSKKKMCDVVRARIKPSKELIGHPCPKPLAWGTKQVEILTEPGDTVIEPFLGSGTVAVACAMLGRRCIGIEKEPEYFEMARRRVERAVTQTGTLWQARKPSDLFGGKQ